MRRLVLQANNARPASRAVRQPKAHNTAFTA
jgi:hypothetical protein